MLQSLAGKWPIQTFADRTDLPASPLLEHRRVPLPSGPVFVRTILFTVLASVVYLWRRGDSRSIRIATEGAFPFCQISHTQFCHRYFLRHHRDALATTWTRRIARTVTHRWCAFLEPLGFRNARTIVVPSQGMARELTVTYPELTKDKIRVIPNPVDTELFQRDPDFCPTDVHQRLGIPEGSFVLSFCALGGFTRKGLPVVFQALAESYSPAIHLIVVGGGTSEIREFTAAAKRLDIGQNVHFAGLQNDIRPYLWSSQAYVFPSAYETFSLACFQAAASALPLIATRLNGVEEFLTDGVNGWLVERTSEAVAAAIREAAASRARTALMGQAAQQSVQAYATGIFQCRWLQLLDREFGIRPGDAPQ